MPVIDPTTPLGQCRLRCADLGDIVILPDSVYTQALTDSGGSVVRASKTCAMYILGILSQRTDRQMGLQLIVKGSQAFQAYKDFLLLTLNNPSFADFSPIPLQSLAPEDQASLSAFISDWNRNYYNGTQSQEMALSADIGPNDGSRYGPLGSGSTLTNGWSIP